MLDAPRIAILCILVIISVFLVLFTLFSVYRLYMLRRRHNALQGTSVSSGTSIWTRSEKVTGANDDLMRIDHMTSSAVYRLAMGGGSESDVEFGTGSKNSHSALLLHSVLQDNDSEPVHWSDVVLDEHLEAVAPRPMTRRRSSSVPLPSAPPPVMLAYGAGVPLGEWNMQKRKERQKSRTKQSLVTSRPNSVLFYELPMPELTPFQLPRFSHIVAQIAVKNDASPSSGVIGNVETKLSQKMNRLREMKSVRESSDVSEPCGEGAQNTQAASWIRGEPIMPLSA